MWKFKAATSASRKRVLLVEKAGIGARFDVVPRAPFVDDQADALLRIVAVHDLAVFRDQLVHDSVRRSVECHPASSNSVAEPLSLQLPVATV